jgi:hypothetical protein
MSFHSKLVACIGALALATAPGMLRAQSAKERAAARLKMAQTATTSMEGTWTLQERTAPDGAPHAKPLEGTTEFHFKMDAATGRATGTARSTERGVLDAAVCAPDIAAAESQRKAARPNANQLFEIEATSDLELSVPTAATAANPMFNLVYTNGNIKGTYGVFRNGVKTKRISAQFRMPASVAGAAADAPQFRLMADPHLPVPAHTSEFGGLSDQSHRFKSLEVVGDRMLITWGNGAKDVWVRAAGK